MTEQQIAAMRQVLEALKIGLDYAKGEQFENTQRFKGYEHLAPDDATSVKEIEDAITALTAALADHALDKKAENARELGLDYEPVIDKSAAIRIATALGWEPKRDWVGLTDEEIDALWAQHDLIRAPDRKRQAFARAIEAKLKEKNT